MPFLRPFAAWLALVPVTVAAQEGQGGGAPPQHAPEAPPVKVSGSYSVDVNLVAAGGTERGAAYLGKLALLVDGDLQRLAGIRNSSVHMSIIDIHGVGLSGRYLGNIATVSGIEAEPAIRLNQLWVETGLGGAARLRAGKFAAAPTFMTSDTAAFFINSTFGWPAIAASDLPQGGPSWPLSAPGVMLTAGGPSGLRLAAAVFAGTPSGSDSVDPQRSDGHGFKAFRSKGAPLLFGELGLDRGPFVLKVGGWRHTGSFARTDHRASAPVQGNWSIYAIADWTANPNASVRKTSLFARVATAPGDRNPVFFYVDAGAVVKAPFAGRPNDAVGLGWSLIGLARAPLTRRRPAAEQVIEFSYSAAVTARISLQPNVQFVIEPANGNRRSALVTGLRFTFQH